MKLVKYLGIFSTAVGLLVFPLSTAYANPSGLQLASLGQNGTIPNSGSREGGVSGITATGRYLTFTSNADNLVPNFTPPPVQHSEANEVYIRDTLLGTTTLVSVNTSGQPANQGAYPGKISSDGRYEYFSTTATNMGVNYGGMTCYLRDLSAHTTTPVNPLNTTTGGNCMDMTPDANILAVNVQGTSSVPGIGCPQFPCNWDGDGYLYNRTTGVITPVAVDTTGHYGIEQPYGVWNSYRANGVNMSNDGNIVTFSSPDNLFTGQYNGGTFVYIRNLTTGSLVQLQASDGRLIRSNDVPVISGNGRYIVYTTHVTNQATSDYKLYVRDLQTGTDTRVDVTPNGTPANGDSLDHSISSDGTFVAFYSQATNLTATGSSSNGHVFVRNMATGATTQEDINAAGQQANDHSEEPYVADSGVTMFESYATNLTTDNAPAPQIYLAPTPVPTPVAAINAGGNAVGGFSTDAGYLGGSPYTSPVSVDTSGVNNPAPQSVYQSVRYGNTMGYSLSGLTPNATYTLRLDFNELYWGTSLANGGGIGSRVFDVAVNGQSALTNYDIYQKAGGANKAIAEQIATTADASGIVTMQFTSVTDNAMVSGISLYAGTLPPQPTPPTPTPVASTLVNAGGSTAGSFVADTDNLGGTAYTSTATVDTTAVNSPAPESVYQSVRYGNFSYNIPNLTPNTQFQVRLHFNELYWGTTLSGNDGGVGSRVFNVAINGSPALTNYDVYQAAGGANKAVVEEFTAQSDAQGKISIQFTSVTDNAMVSGIEIVLPNTP
jgi:hypothetical protein